VPQDELFEFLQSLADDLNGKLVKLPSFPDVVMRIRAALDDPETTGEDIETILHMDAVLASRMLILANSAYYNPGGNKVDSLNAAVSRIGFKQVRTAAISYAVEQLYASEDLKPLKHELRKTWTAGLSLAALSEAIARKCTDLDPDSAFVAGLLNRIGVLYIFSKYKEYPTILESEDARQELIDEWAAPISESIVANWDFPDEIVATMNPTSESAASYREEANLADVVTTARLSLSGDETDWHESVGAKRLQLDTSKMASIIDMYEQRLESLTTALH
jgi:HD-like signal output (HDOD) protein